VSMHRKIRVLVVDDSVAMRRILADAISSDPELEVAGYAANGQIAMAMFDQVSPDVVTLDVEMPVMDGLSTLKAMRAARRLQPVIMFSTLTERGAEATIDSLSLGASDYVAKPIDAGSFDIARERIRQALIPKIKVLCHVSPPGEAVHRAANETARKPVLRRANPFERIEVVVIGSSTGGPNALATVLPKIPSGFPVPVLIVQHMPPAFTRFLAQRLTVLCPQPVAEAAPGDVASPGMIRVAPGDHHLAVTRDRNEVRLQITQGPAENSCRPSADVLFRSAAQVFANRVLAVVLTGMGQDGLRGCETLADLGASIMVQDEATSVVWGMPGFVAKAGLADAVLPLSEIGEAIVRRVTAFRPISIRQNSPALVAR
jgi:two-component system, chemotaxis family, protein-glutamate methylesterase/glutaminase